MSGSMCIISTEKREKPITDVCPDEETPDHERSFSHEQ